MRKLLPKEISEWLAKVMESKGVPPEEAKKTCSNLTFGFEPGDMVSNVMSFGSPTPLEIVVYGNSLPNVRAHAMKVREKMAAISCLRDVQFQQALDYPTVDVNIDR